MRARTTILLAFAALALLAIPAAATNYTCGEAQEWCNYELQEGDWVTLWSGFQANAFNIEFDRAYLRFLDSYGNYLASLELAKGQEGTATGALTKAKVSGIRMFNDSVGIANITLTPVRPNLKLVVDEKPDYQWPVVQQGGVISVQDYVTNITITNDGETPVGNVTFSFLLRQDGETVGFPMDKKLQELKPGQSVAVPFDGVAWSTLLLPQNLPATFSIVLAVDRQNFVIESNELDNEVVLNVSVRPIASPSPTAQPTPTATPVPTPTMAATAAPTVEVPTEVPTPVPQPALPVDIKLAVAIAFVALLALAAWYLTRPKGQPPAQKPQPAQKPAPAAGPKPASRPGPQQRTR